MTLHFSHKASSGLRHVGRLAILLLCLCLLVAYSKAIGLQPPSEPVVPLHNFPLMQGLNPYNGSVILGQDGALYGITSGGGTGSGLIYRVNQDGSGFQVLHVFTPILTNLFDIINLDGYSPHATLMQGPNGTLYGTTTGGGLYNNGVAFRLNTDGSGFKVLHNFFAAVGDGGGPWAALILGQDGNLYGTTYYGGANGDGTVFQLSTDGSHYQVIYNFDPNVGGINPRAALVQDASGNLWGTAVVGGAYNDGTIFELIPNSSATTGFDFMDVHDFNPNTGDGLQPTAPMVLDSNGVLYGTTVIGGAFGMGTVFSLDTNTSTYTTLYSFGALSHDGSLLYTAVVLDSQGSFLYGVTWEGGQFGQGTVFQLSVDGSVYNILHNFNQADGANPESVLALSSNNILYGTTVNGGSQGYGTIFSQSTTSSNGQLSFQTLRSFTVPTVGTLPRGLLLQARDGYFYGVTEAGVGSGAYGDSPFSGVLYKIAPDGSQFQVLHAFSGSDPNNGADPRDSLMQGLDGAFYGTTSSGGAHGSGTIYRWSHTSGFALLHSFQGSDGSFPHSRLAQGPNGVLYGTCYGGGTYGSGVVFSISPNGSNFQVLHSFAGFSNLQGDGGNPNVGVIVGNNGYLYGTTLYGGANNHGIVFRLSPSNPSDFTVLHAFGNLQGGLFDGTNTDGALLYGGVVQDAQGNLYGLARNGGLYHSGTLYKIDAQGNFSVLHQFVDGEGSFQDATLLLANNGLLYGVSLYGGVNGNGSIYQIDTSGNNFQVIHQISPSNPDGTNQDGAFNVSGLIQAADGDLYGVSFLGGSLGGGLLYRIGPAANSLSPSASPTSNQPLILTVVGSGFSSSDTVLWNNQPLATTLMDDQHLQATVPAALLANPGSATVQVQDTLLKLTTKPLVFLIGQAVIQLKVTAIVRDGAGVHVSLQITNVGGAMASNVSVGQAKLRTTSSSTLATNTPAFAGNIAEGGGSTVVVLNFPTSTPSGAALLSVQGSYQGGSFGGSFRVTVP